MTTDAAAAKARRRRPGPLRVILASVALLAVVLVLLAERVAAGTDPVLQAASHRDRPRQVLVRRIVRKVIVETTVPTNRRTRPTTVSSSSPTAISQAAAVSPEPVTRSS